MRDTLVHLAGLYGIAADYYDIWGTRHEVSDASLIGLLDAMNIRADTPEAIAHALSGHEHARWQELLPPVRVLRENEQPWLLRLNLSPALDNAELAWRIEEESGAQHSGLLRPAALHSPEHYDAGGEPRTAREWPLELQLPPGYHRLFLHQGGRLAAECLLIVAPKACYQPLCVQDGGRVWGCTAQLYALRSVRNWGMGDYADLGALMEEWSARGASIAGMSPLHALYPHNPSHCSPYSPSSRLFKNVLYLAVDAMEDFVECAQAQAQVNESAFQARLQQLRASLFVDYPGVAAQKFAVLETLYDWFRRTHLAAHSDRARAFRDFQNAGGETLRRHTLFEALQEHFHRQDANIWGWPVWPAAYRNPEGLAVRQFAEANETRIEFYQYLQWQADLQLAALGARSQQMSLGIGLYEDLAVSIDRGGAEVWANQSLYALGASVGAPPDEFNLQGQNWGLPPLIPERLRAARYASFIDTLRANMRHAGALRIDHVMGLARLFWVPPGQSAAYGAYVRYPLEDMFGILALESHRQSCMVIGEDLGTVPDEVRAALHRNEVLSYRLLYFERREGGDFKAPQEYPAGAIVAAATHDLPTLAGWWEGADIELRTQLNLFPDPAMRETQWVARTHDRARLLQALERESLLPEGLSTDPVAVPVMTSPLAQAIAAYLASTPAKVAVLQLEDLLGVREQANLPGTIDEHPNWRRKLPLPLESIATDPRFIEVVERLNSLRP